MSGIRSGLYRSARALGDLSAASKGPGAYGKRLIRKRAYRRSNALLAQILRAFGL
jgi:hypothetical protein